MTPNSKGFEISFDAVRQFLMIHVWGIWDTDFAKKFDNGMREQIEKISANGKLWSALVDVTEFRPQSEEVICIMNNYIPFAREQGMKKIGYLGNGQFTQGEPESLFSESDTQLCACFTSEDDAIQWLLSKEELNITE